MAQFYKNIKSGIQGAFGKVSSQQQHHHHGYKLLLLGETGSGKTSFLNLLCNCGLIQAMGFDEGSKQLRNFNDIKLENANSRKLESKTSDAKLYNVELGTLKVGVIDTPGFGDTRGLEEDKKHTKRIIEVLKHEEYINCVCLVINGRQSRMTATLKYVLTDITSILPREVLNNVILVFTNTADVLDLNFEQASLKDFFGRQFEHTTTFYIENPYCRLEKAKEKQKQIPHAQIVQSLKRSFDETGEELTRMCSTIESFKQVHTLRFTTLYQKKQQIEKEVLKMLAAYDYQQELEAKIMKTEEEVNAALRNKRLNANFHFSETKPAKWITVTTNRHNTLCGAKGCYSNCHMSCNLEKSFDNETFRSCWCIRSSKKPDHCTICGHHYMNHYHNEVCWEKTGGTTEFVINEETKKKFEAAKNMEERAVVAKQQLEYDKAISEKERKKLSEQLLLTIEEFHKLGVNRNYAKLLENQLAIIEHRLEGTDGQETHYLRKTKEEIQKKLDLVQATMKEPWSSYADASMQLHWACKLLEVKPSATRDEVIRAYKKTAMSTHPDKTGKDDEYYKRVERAKEILLRNK